MNPHRMRHLGIRDLILLVYALTLPHIFTALN